MPNHTIISLLQGAVTDVRNLTEAKLELLQLKLADKGSSAAAGGLYNFFLFLILKLFVIVFSVTGGFAFSLLFIKSAVVFETIKALLFGFLCMLGVLLIVVGIMLLLKKKFTESLRSKVINEVIDQLEAQEKERIIKRAMSQTYDETRCYEESYAKIREDITNQVNE